jgi:hypothetical protein
MPLSIKGMFIKFIFLWKAVKLTKFFEILFSIDKQETSFFWMRKHISINQILPQFYMKLVHDEILFQNIFRLIVVGWILVAGTFILCGIFLLFHKYVSSNLYFKFVYGKRKIIITEGPWC